jgi:hypothetical protein
MTGVGVQAPSLAEEGVQPRGLVVQPEGLGDKGRP